MDPKRRKLAIVFIVLFFLWAGWSVLREGNLARGPVYQGPQTSWKNEDGYTDFELKFLNLTAYELEVHLQAKVHSYGAEVTSFGRGGRLLGSRKMKVVMPGREELVVKDRISHAQEPDTAEKVILSVETDPVSISSASRIRRTLGQLFIGGIVLAVLLIGLRLLPDRTEAEKSHAPGPAVGPDSSRE